MKDRDLESIVDFGDKNLIRVDYYLGTLWSEVSIAIGSSLI